MVRKIKKCILCSVLSMFLLGCNAKVNDAEVISDAESLEDFEGWNINSSDIVLSDTQNKDILTYNVDISATKDYIDIVSHKQLDYKKYDQGWVLENVLDVSPQEISLNRELDNDEILNIYNEKFYADIDNAPALSLESSSQDISNNIIELVMKEEHDYNFGKVIRSISQTWIFNPSKIDFDVETSNIDDVDYVYDFDSFVGKTVQIGTEGNSDSGTFRLDSVEYNSETNEVYWSGHLYYLIRENSDKIIEGDVTGTAKYFDNNHNYATKYAQISNPNLTGVIDTTLVYSIYFDISKGLGAQFKGSAEYTDD